MIDALITLILFLIVAGVLWWGATRILAAFPIPEPFRTVIYVVMTVLACLIAVYAVAPLLHVGTLRLR